MTIEIAECVYRALLAGDRLQYERSQRTGKCHPCYGRADDWNKPESIEAQATLGTERCQSIMWSETEARQRS